MLAIILQCPTSREHRPKDSNSTRNRQAVWGNFSEQLTIVDDKTSTTLIRCGSLPLTASFKYRLHTLLRADKILIYHMISSTHCTESIKLDPGELQQSSLATHYRWRCQVSQFQLTKSVLKWLIWQGGMFWPISSTQPLVKHIWCFWRRARYDQIVLLTVTRVRKDHRPTEPRHEGALCARY